MFFVFFFQAEDGIRDWSVTGVQTCALPILSVQIHDTERNEPGGRAGFQGPEFLDYVEHNHAFDRVIANDNEEVLYRSGGGTERINGNQVTPGSVDFLCMKDWCGSEMQVTEYG